MKRIAAVLLFLSAPAIGQNWPKPSTQINTPVPCPVGSPCAGRSIAPYAAPLEYAGRWGDSTECGDNGQPNPRIRRFRTMRLDSARDLLWQIQGSQLAVYKLSTFVQRLVAGEQLLAGQARGNPLCSERFLGVIANWNAIRGEDPGFNVHAQDQLLDFDTDDRGYVYAARDPQAWIVLRFNAAGPSPSLDVVSQDWPQTSYPSHTVAFRSGTRYYLAAGSAATGMLYDVTNPSAPARVRPLAGFEDWAKVGDRIAFVSGGRLVMTSAAALAQGLAVAPITAPAGVAVTSVTVSGGGFVAAARAGGEPVQVWIEGSGWIGTGLRYLSGPAIRCNAYYCAMHGDETTGFNLRLFRLAAGSLAPVPLLSSGDRQAFALLYHNVNLAAASGYAASGRAGEPADIAFTAYGGRTVMLDALGSLADAWYIDGAAPAPVPVPAPQPPPAPAPPSTAPPASACPPGCMCVCPPIQQPSPPVVTPQPKPPTPAPQAPGCGILPPNCYCINNQVMCR